MEPHSGYSSGPFSGREKAIRNLGGMVWLYEKHLTKFMTAYSDSPASIRNYLAEGNIHDARILTHSIKGLSATLGMDRLHHASCSLENAIKNHSCNIEIQLVNYEICINEILIEFKKR